MSRTIRGTLRHFGLAVATVALAMLFKAITDSLFGAGPPLILFLSAVMVTARFAGPVPGLTATLLSALVCDYYYFPPGHTLAIHSHNDAFRLGVFVLEGLALSGLMGSLHAARRRAEEGTRRILGQKEALRESEERLRLLIQGVRDYAILMLDPGGRVVSWNAGAERIKGYRESEILGEHFSRFYPPEDLAAGKPAYELEVAGATGRFEEEGWRLRKDGSRFWASVTIAAVRDDSGRLRGFAKVTRDLTDRRQAEEELRRAREGRTAELEQANAALEAEVAVRRNAEREARVAREAAEAASRAKGEFLANMSHEIRTPMNGILGMTELALGTDLSDRQREYLGLVKSSGDALLTVIDEILDFSKIEAGKLTLDPVPFAVRDAVTDTLRTLAIRAHAKGLELACRIAPEVPEWLVGDPGRLRQVLVNLVGNAIKFTEAGEVCVSVEGDQGQVVRFAVADTGIGIPAAKREAIFAPFEQADGSTTRRYGGTGLGLTISGRLVDLMGGRIWVEDNPGGGSVFRFTARLAADPESRPGPRPADPTRLVGLRVLVVDDNRTNRLILAELLTQWGCRATSAVGGPEALAAMAGAVSLGEPFEVVLLDRMMPGMDGPELAGRVRRDPELAGVKVLLLTSGGSDESGRFRELGVGGCLSKPIRHSDLFDALIDLLEPARAPRPVTAPARVQVGPRPAGRRLRVLLAEDHPINQKVATRMLEGEGHEVTIAGDGRAAVEAWGAGAFDVILMDVQMPVMDGFEALATIRRREEGSDRHVPIVVLTAHAMAGDRERFLGSGFDDYLSKPIGAATLRGVLDRIDAPGRGLPGPHGARPPS